jgi:hypothetical protein
MPLLCYMPLAGALQLLRSMQSGHRGAPSPRVDTYNTLLGGLRNAGATNAILTPTLTLTPTPTPTRARARPYPYL